MSPVSKYFAPGAVASVIGQPRVVLVLRSSVGSATLNPLGDPITVQLPLTLLVADNGAGVLRADLPVNFLCERAAA